MRRANPWRPLNGGGIVGSRSTMVVGGRLTIGPTLMSTLIKLLMLIMIAGWTARGEEIVTTLNVSNRKSKDAVNIGTSKTQNYHIADYKYQPTQVTQLVFNGKPKGFDKNKMRVSRPPTRDEFAIKQRILEIYDELAESIVDSSSNSNSSNNNNIQSQTAEQATNAYRLLGRVLQALNPKYIATDRVRRAAFQLDEQVPPLPDYYQHPIERPPLDLNIASGPVAEQLDRLLERFGQQVTWDDLFPMQLLGEADSHLKPEHRALKRLLLCLSQSRFCPEAKIAGEDKESHHQDQQTSSLQSPVEFSDRLDAGVGTNFAAASPVNSISGQMDQVRDRKLTDSLLLPRKLIPRLPKLAPTSEINSREEWLRARQMYSAAATPPPADTMDAPVADQQASASEPVARWAGQPASVRPHAVEWSLEPAPLRGAEPRFGQNEQQQQQMDELQLDENLLDPDFDSSNFGGRLDQRDYAIQANQPHVHPPYYHNQQADYQQQLQPQAALNLGQMHQQSAYNGVSLAAYKSPVHTAPVGLSQQIGHVNQQTQDYQQIEANNPLSTISQERQLETIHELPHVASSLGGQPGLVHQRFPIRAPSVIQTAGHQVQMQTVPNRQESTNWPNKIASQQQQQQQQQQQIPSHGAQSPGANYEGIAKSRFANRNGFLRFKDQSGRLI